MDETEKDGALLHWFRYDLRLHDMPALKSGLKKCSTLYPVYIFDEHDIITQKFGYNRLRFILDSLKDINHKLQKHNGRLYVFKGNPIDVLRDLFNKWKITHLSYEHDIQPSWVAFKDKVHKICEHNNVRIVEGISRTLWKTEDIVETNGGSPPVSYDLFCQVVESLGPPQRPDSEISFQGVTLAIKDMPHSSIPECPEELGTVMECPEQKNKVWQGGEIRALKHLEERMKIEENAHAEGYFMPNQLTPDLLGPPMSMSAALSNGCLSVRKFYWSLRDLDKSVEPDEFVRDGLVGQLIWREYFYTMCMNNPNFHKMLENPICLNIDWIQDNEMLEAWTKGRTGFPLIDAAMRQLLQEGWIHHVARNSVACFLTRGDLWISWEEGLKVFLKYLVDADLPVCAGNWMWVSSSAFEVVLQSSLCISPTSYLRRFEPSGQYIKKYVKELSNMPGEYLFEPWLAPIEVQKSAGCILGKDYPLPIVEHQAASEKNSEKMDSVKAMFLPSSIPIHYAPSNSSEACVFLWLPENCLDSLP